MMMNLKCLVNDDETLPFTVGIEYRVYKKLNCNNFYHFEESGLGFNMIENPKGFFHVFKNGNVISFRLVEE